MSEASQLDWIVSIPAHKTTYRVTTPDPVWNQAGTVGKWETVPSAAEGVSKYIYVSQNDMSGVMNDVVPADIPSPLYYYSQRVVVIENAAIGMRTPDNDFYWSQQDVSIPVEIVKMEYASYRIYSERQYTVGWWYRVKLSGNPQSEIFLVHQKDLSSADISKCQLLDQTDPLHELSTLMLHDRNARIDYISQNGTIKVRSLNMRLVYIMAMSYVVNPRGSGKWMYTVAKLPCPASITSTMEAEIRKTYLPQINEFPRYMISEEDLMNLPRFNQDDECIIISGARGLQVIEDSIGDEQELPPNMTVTIAEMSYDAAARKWTYVVNEAGVNNEQRQYIVLEKYLVSKTNR